MPRDDALFSPDGGTYVPALMARGPWDAGALHGGAPAALVAHLLESYDFDVDGRFTRLSLELLRPVPLDGLEIDVRVVRAGRQVQWLAAEIEAGGKVVARAQATRVRTQDIGLGGAGAGAGGEGTASIGTERERPMPPPSAGVPRGAPPGGEPGGFADEALELLFVRGEFGVPGPAAAWFRFRTPLLPGVPASPFALAAAVSDFGNGIANVVDWNEYTFLNADVTLHLDRMPRGEWLGSDAVTHLADDGTGVAHARLHDQDGPVGRAAQSLLIARRPT